MNCQQCLRLWHCHHSQRLLMEDWMIVAINFLGTLHMIMPHCQGCRRWLTILNNIWSGIFWITGRDVGHLVRWEELGAVPDHEQLDFVRVSSFNLSWPSSLSWLHWETEPSWSIAAYFRSTKETVCRRDFAVQRKSIHDVQVRFNLHERGRSSFQTLRLYHVSDFVEVVLKFQEL